MGPEDTPSAKRRLEDSTAQSPAKRGKFVVPVTRPVDVEKGRSSLPIVMMEQEIMEAVYENPVVIICGETGCGKTTQIPQFLFEAGFGSKQCRGREGVIGVTQPRRVAVLSTARRVAYELSCKLGQEVGFQVRHDRKIGENSAIKFMTDGILLREVQTDFLLSKYSVIVLDEAHERSLNTDILIGMLSRIVRLRQSMYEEEQCKAQGVSAPVSGACSVAPLKLVIMSATLRVEDFVSNKKLFNIPPPVLQVPARQYPVTVHFSARTALQNYEDAAYKKVAAIHRKLPPGGILVFLTGQREVESLCKRLRKSFGHHRKRRVQARVGSSAQDSGSNQEPGPDIEFDGVELDAIRKAVDDGGRFDSSMDGPDDVDCVDASERVEVELDDTSEDDVDSVISDTDDELFPAGPCANSSSQAAQNGKDANSPPGGKPSPGKTEDDSNLLYVLPLYAMLPAVAQLRVFAAVPKGMRVAVVATNVAETSITIPGIRYVVDSGRAKAREFDQTSGISKFEVQWISKASADQRAGRAGRTGPGHCYRLYSSAHFNDTFPPFSPPEINVAPIENVVLLMKHMGIDKVINFPFPTPPDRTSMVEAERCLKALSALDSSTGSLTPVGKAMALYPVSPRHARMLLAALESAQSLEPLQPNFSPSLFLACAVATVAAFSLENPLLKDVSSAIDSPGDSLHGNGLAHDVEGGLTDMDPEVRASEEAKSLAAEKAERKLRRRAINVAHAKFWNEHGDALCIMRALHAYEQSEERELFCKANFLHERTMHEMLKLRQQLLRLLMHFSPEAGAVPEVVSSLAESETAWRQPHLKLDAEYETLLQKAICAGWADRVARKLTAEERAKVQDGKQRKGAMYQACLVNDYVYIHPSSTVYKEAPEYVVYGDIIQTSRPYMCGVTAIQGSWLVCHASPLCTFSKPLADPPPWYDSNLDQIMCWVSPSFGPHLWPLPLHPFPMKSGKLRTAVFATALLQGKVLPSVSSIRACLSADPSIIFKPESMGQKRVGELIHKLGSGSSAICSRRLLSNAWEVDESFLYRELRSWVQSAHAQKLDKIWVAMREEAKLDGSSLFGSKKGRPKMKTKP